MLSVYASEIMSDPGSGHIFLCATDSPPPHLIKLGSPALDLHKATVYIYCEACQAYICCYRILQTLKHKICLDFSGSSSNTLYCPNLFFNVFDVVVCSHLVHEMHNTHRPIMFLYL